MPTAIGIDIIEIERIREALARRPQMAARLFTTRERAYCAGRADASPHYAARFAAKEAVAKTLGRPLEWHDVEIINDDAGRPVVVLYRRASALAKTSQGGRVLISLSHSRDYAVASAMLLLPDARGEACEVRP